MKIVKGYRHTGITCKDLKKSQEFYEDYLGLEVIQDFWDDSDYINQISGMKGAYTKRSYLQYQIQTNNCQ